MDAGKVIIFTGTGKGKSSAALGLALRQAAKGRQVIFIQFLKSGEIAESELFKRLEPQIRFFRFEKSERAFEEMSDEERREETENLRNGLHFAKKVLDTAECDILVMDEVLGLIDNHIITLEELSGILARRGDTRVIITGVSMSSDYCSIADEISEITTFEK
ncbi:MAG: cob(I)yrinic acid a,c-diamide adenosyltransferase [Lachnospiraceae bacterium]|nr:cob(I)yrinic acid a,c-diamide adenosyltransferase [Lachnospiraceae bacterium]